MGDHLRHGIFWLGVLVYAASLLWFLLAGQPGASEDGPVLLAAWFVIGAGIVGLVPLLTRILTRAGSPGIIAPGTPADDYWAAPGNRQTYVRRVAADIRLLGGAFLMFMSVNLVVGRVSDASLTWLTLVFGAGVLAYILWLQRGSRYAPPREDP